MVEVFARIEQWPLSIWAREDTYAYFVALISHAFGMALLAGGGIAISLRALGLGSGGSGLPKFRGFLPVLWLGAGLAAASGLVLLVAYPAKAFTNPVFAVKFACLGAAVALLPRLLRPASTGSHRMLAVLSLALWLGAVAAGKLLLHTYRVLQVS